MTNQDFQPTPFVFGVPPVHPQQPEGVTTEVVVEMPKGTKGRRGPLRKEKAKIGRPKKEVMSTDSGPPPTPRVSFRPKKARTIKIDLALAMSAMAGLTEDDTKFLTGVIQAMQPFSSAQRKRIVGALGKVFA